MLRIAVPLGAVLGFLGVALGAMGAHLFQATLTANGRTETFQTAAHYHLTHAIMLAVIGLAAARLDAKWAGRSALCIALGILFFSGSLYILSLANLRIMGAVAPIGGSLMMLGWLMLIPAAKPLITHHES